MTTGPRPHHDDPDDRDPRGHADGEAPGGRDAAGVAPSVFTSLVGNVAFLLVLTACGAGVLALLGRNTGALAIAGVSGFTLVSYLAFRRAFERVEATAVEGLVSWLVWTALIGSATACYAVDWRIMGAGALAIVLILSFVNTYFLVMRPDVVDDLMRRARERDDGPPRGG